MTSEEYVKQTHPEAFEDDCGTIWTNKERSVAGNSDTESDVWLDEVLGWSWEDVATNQRELRRFAERKAFWLRHRILLRIMRFLRNWYQAIILFLSIVWRKDEGYRLGIGLSWQVASDLWLK